MDIIKTQASSQIAISYLATAVAFLSLLFVYPLDLAAYGLAQFLSMTAMFLLPFVTLGTYASVVKFFPEFQGTKHSGSYLLYLLTISTVAMAAALILAFVTRDQVYTWLEMLGFDVLLIRTNAMPMIVMTLFVVYGRILTLHAANYNKTGVPTFWNQLFPKVVLPALIYLLYLGIIGTETLFWVWTSAFGIIVLGLIVYLRTIGALDMTWDWGGFRMTLLKKVSVYSMYTGLSMVGSVLANRLDVIMVTLLLGEEQNGIYLIAMFIASVMQIPTGAVWQITSPQIAKAWEENDLAHISKLYHRSSSNLFVVGIVVYFLFLGTIDSIFQLTANYEALRTGIAVFALLGIARLLDMLTSINTQILMYSEKFRMNTVFVVILGISNVGLNYVFINEYGLTGAALATLTAVALYNLLKSLYLFFQYSLSPFSRDIYKILLLGAILGLFYYVFPTISHPVLHVAAYGLAMAVVSLALIFLLRINTDFLPFFKSKSMSLIRKFLERGGK